MSFIYNHTSPRHWTELHVVSFTDKKSKQKQVYWLGLCTKKRIPSGQLHKKKGFSPQSKTLCYIHLHTYNYFIGCNHCFKLVQSIKWLALGKKECNNISNVGWQKKVEKLVTGNMTRKWMDLQRVKLCSISFYKITKIESLFLLVKNLWFIVPVNS